MNKSIVTVVAAALAAAALPAARAGSAAHDAAHHDAPPAASAAAATKHHAVGVVRSVDPRAGTVMIAHEPIASLGWPAMSMAFRVRDQRALAKLRTGSAVEFDFVQANDGYVVTAIK